MPEGVEIFPTLPSGCGQIGNSFRFERTGKWALSPSQGVRATPLPAAPDLPPPAPSLQARHGPDFPQPRKAEKRAEAEGKGKSGAETESRSAPLLLERPLYISGWPEKGAPKPHFLPNPPRASRRARTAPPRLRTQGAKPGQKACRSPAVLSTLRPVLLPTPEPTAVACRGCGLGIAPAASSGRVRRCWCT